MALVLVGTYVLTGEFGTHHSPKAEVLINKGVYYSIPADQFNSAAFETSGTAVVAGTVWNTWGINVYLMSPQQLEDLSIKGVVEGYAWTSGRIANLTESNLSISVDRGAWDVVFLNTDNPTMNPIWTNITEVGFYTDLTVNPS